MDVVGFSTFVTACPVATRLDFLLDNVELRSDLLAILSKSLDVVVINAALKSSLCLITLFIQDVNVIQVLIDVLTLRHRKLENLAIFGEGPAYLALIGISAQTINGYVAARIAILLAVLALLLSLLP